MVMTEAYTYIVGDSVYEVVFLAIGGWILHDRSAE
jgi:hypothetical protein